MEKEEYIKKSDLIRYLLKEGLLKEEYGYNIVERIKPNHGNCCTCQDCGQSHEECVCSHNSLILDIESFPVIVFPTDPILVEREWASEIISEIEDILDNNQRKL